jgi:hypothetical protein
VAEWPIAPVLKGDRPISGLPTKTRENPAKHGVFALPGVLPKRPETSRNVPKRALPVVNTTAFPPSLGTAAGARSTFPGISVPCAPSGPERSTRRIAGCGTGQKDCPVRPREENYGVAGGASDNWGHSPSRRRRSGGCSRSTDRATLRSATAVGKRKKPATVYQRRLFAAVGSSPHAGHFVA